MKPVAPTVNALEGIRILELGQLIAGPFAAKILGEFGAEVIKVESPVTGDPLRKWRMLHNENSLWWEIQSRNKKSLALDLRDPAAQDVIKRLITECDVLIENFRPGTLESWGLGWEELQSINPKLIMLRVSGYGQTGPYKDRPGFGVVGEAMGGLRHLSGEAGRPPVRVGISIGDSLTALHGVIGILIALRHRDVNGGLGQVIDAALYESVFNMMESLLPEYSVFGAVREPAGSRLPGITPSNAYRCADGKYALIAGNGDAIFRRLMNAIGRPDVAEVSDYAQNDGRAKAADYIDSVIAEWAGKNTLDDVLEALHQARVPAGRVYDIADIVADPHYQAREMIINDTLPDGSPIKVPGIVPKLSATPGGIHSKAPSLGQHSRQLLRDAGLSDEQINDLIKKGVVGTNEAKCTD
ncbi:CoA transferase [Paenalcaligenes niemegkensis]|uniref:CaiB/BaiF CoA transferase family protein n=1 Tax=Paenalcaligenes niemegkensis TaxID=2895469 RepID=UPI001EE7F3ED|nr:CaiB/BaiF CoA-transferase family protein [Paenalcaligenes niemegkensis]MCQ9616592.1 CoA transferase [Paenalcaligenes niemegkensis]